MAGKEMKGTVKWFSAKRGYGFLVDADGIDYFVHYSEIQSEGFKTLRNNMEVSFMVEEDERDEALQSVLFQSQKKHRKKNKRLEGADKNASVPG